MYNCINLRHRVTNKRKKILLLFPLVPGMIHIKVDRNGAWVSNGGFLGNVGPSYNTIVNTGRANTDTKPARAMSPWAHTRQNPRIGQDPRLGQNPRILPAQPVPGRMANPRDDPRMFVCLFEILYSPKPNSTFKTKI